MNLIIGFILLILGGIGIVNPEAAWNLRTFVGKKFFDMKYVASKKTFERFRLLGIVYILMGLFIMVAGANAPIPSPYVTTITGEYTCLPHKDTSGPITLECAFGLKTQDGKHYSLDFGDPPAGGGDMTRFVAGETDTLTGTFTPVEYLSSEQIYDIVGVLSVQ